MRLKTETFLLQLVERGSLEPLSEVYERNLERGENEYDFSVEDRMKRSFLVEIESLIKHTPSLRRKLAGSDWVIDCTVV